MYLILNNIYQQDPFPHFFDRKETWSKETLDQLLRSLINCNTQHKTSKLAIVILNSIQNLSILIAQTVLVFVVVSYNIDCSLRRGRILF